MNSELMFFKYLYVQNRVRQLGQLCSVSSVLFRSTVESRAL